MRNLLLALLTIFISVSAFSATYYCEAPKWGAETRFDGTVGAPNAAGTLIYFGPNPGDAETEGTYKFSTIDSFKMYFEGEPVHTCTKWKTGEWYCKMGKWFMYKMVCDF